MLEAQIHAKIGTGVEEEPAPKPKAVPDEPKAAEAKKPEAKTAEPKASEAKAAEAKAAEAKPKPQKKAA